jgi:hypothetical protein
MDGEPVRHPTYVAYMLRLWQAGSRGGQVIWRASLENPHTGERLAFGDEEALFAFLADLMADLTDARDSPDKGESPLNGDAISRESQEEGPGG